MAQREEEIRLSPCANCGFLANPATGGMCQACFQTSGSVPPPASGRAGSVHVAFPPRAAEGKSGERAAAAAGGGPGRCAGCARRVGLATGFRCRCGGLFCGAHRYSDRHGCSFDYKAAGRAAIARDNPVVLAPKITRF